MRSLRTSPLLWSGMLAGVAMVLGFIAYSTSPESMSRVDAFYRTLQLFVLDSGPQPGGTPWELEVARFLAPVAIGSAAVAATAAFLRDQYQRLLITLLARDHVVVVGLSSSAGYIAEALRAQGHSVVVVEADRAHPRLPGLRASGARTVVGDGRQGVTLERARVERASHVIVTTGNDAVSLDVADRVRSIRAEQGRGHTIVHVAIDDAALWLEVGRLTFGRNPSGTSVECFNREDRAASRIVDVAMDRAGGRPTGIRVEGGGSLRERVVAHLERRAVLAGVKLELDDPDATVAVVGGSADGGADSSVARAIALARLDPRLHVVAAVTGDTADTLLDLLGDLADRVTIVPTTASSLADDFLQASAIELMARAKHDDYLEQERAQGHTVAHNPSLVGWTELPESLRVSNRRFAASVAETLSMVGATLVPLHDGEAPTALGISGPTLDALSIREHDRWAADLRADGWTYGAGAKDPIARTHPLLVSWDELDEPEREKDRDAIRAIPSMLARVGYAVQLPSGDDAELP
ncbi:RyR domain-containing protein [Nocardioides sp. MH1]|uniref:RyR domain-containing protein n=1 Tax=Nocardioides sp. MH1 TaxID=3242490 RepID=UPI00352134DD